MAVFTEAQLRAIYLPLNINRSIPNNLNLITMQRPNNSLSLIEVFEAMVELDSFVGLTFTNGLTKTANDVELGGTLTAHTNIDLDSFALTFDNTDHSLQIGPVGLNIITNSSFILNGGEGTSGQAILSQGAGVTPIWGDTVTASNGLTEASNNVKLGGTLIEDTVVEGSTFDLSLVKGDFGLVVGQTADVITPVEGVHAYIKDVGTKKGGVYLTQTAPGQFPIFSAVSKDTGTNEAHSVTIFEDITLTSTLPATATSTIQVEGASGVASQIKSSVNNETNIDVVSTTMKSTSLALSMASTATASFFTAESRIATASTADFEIIVENLPVYANDAAALADSYPTDGIYKTATGELRIKI